MRYCNLLKQKKKAKIFSHFENIFLLGWEASKRWGWGPHLIQISQSEKKRKTPYLLAPLLISSITGWGATCSPAIKGATLFASSFGIEADDSSFTIPHTPLELITLKPILATWLLSQRDWSEHSNRDQWFFFFFFVVAAMDAIAAASTLCPSSVPCSRQWRTGVPCKVSVQVPVKGEIYWCCEFNQFVLQSSVLNWQPGCGADCEFSAASSETFLTSLRRNAVEVCGLCGMFPNWGGVIVGRNGHCEFWGWIPIERRRPVMQVLSFLRHLPQ